MRRCSIFLVSFANKPFSNASNHYPYCSCWARAGEPKNAKAKFRHAPLGARGFVLSFYSAQLYFFCRSCSALPYRSVARISDIWVLVMPIIKRTLSVLQMGEWLLKQALGTWKNSFYRACLLLSFSFDKLTILGRHKDTNWILCVKKNHENDSTWGI